MDSLPVMEDFYTIQGEGYYQGQAAYFIRLGGCDVGCVWCDVKESWNADAHPVVDVSEIAGKARQSGSPMAVVTGGEPAMHNLTACAPTLRLQALIPLREVGTGCACRRRNSRRRTILFPRSRTS